jgi:phenylalanyl-tRNA synthetase beta chain
LKFSYQWLRELVPGLATEPADLQRLITMKTAECEGIEPTGLHFASVVAARVVSVEPLPKGKNRAVRIDIGRGKIVSVVCGASNVRPGMLAPWVPPGTLLGDKTIGRATIEGVESEGMLASSAELGISRDHAGLLELTDAEAGEPLKGLSPDWIIEIDNKSLTHRPDLWGHYGMAREVAAISGQPLVDPVHPGLLPGGAPVIQVEIADHALCPRYSALVFENVRVGPSPLWLQARLEHLGLNPINNAVDVTNYVLAELPQPMHAFDADKLAGGTIFVRLARAGEELVALNSETYQLTDADLVIADASGPIALAGVIGGAGSAISESTTRVVLESANFQASSVRLTSSRHKLRTDASMRFEKALDPENTVRGLARAVELLREVCPGIRLVGGVADNRSAPVTLEPIILPMSFVVRKLGKAVSQAEVTGILRALGFGATESASEILTVTVPTWRATKDISLKDDLVEEVGRMIGYDSIAPAAPMAATIVPPLNVLRAHLRGLRGELTAQGFTEVHNYSFVTENDIRRFHGDPASHISVLNPIASELTHLRRSLLPGLFKNVLTNVRFFPVFRLFEAGSEIHGESGEVPHIAGVLYNAHGNEQDFFEMKRAVECIFPAARLTAAEGRAYEHPMRTAEIHWHHGVIGRLFELHPLLLQTESIEGRSVFFDIDLAEAQKIDLESPAFRYTPLRKYPTSGFDLSVVTDLKTSVDGIQNELTRLAGASLVAIQFIRHYSGAPLPQGQKSISYHLKLGALDHTMTAEEVTGIRNGIIQGMQALGFELRGL